MASPSSDRKQDRRRPSTFTGTPTPGEPAAPVKKYVLVSRNRIGRNTHVRAAYPRVAATPRTVPRIGGHAPAPPVRRRRPADRHLRERPGPAPPLRARDRVRRAAAPAAAG